MTIRNWLGVCAVLVAASLTLPAAASDTFPNTPATKRVTYVNACKSAPIWIGWQITTASVQATQSGSAVYQHLDMKPAHKLAPGAQVSHDIPDAGLIGYRAWPMYNCKKNAAGDGPAEGWYDCQIGGSGGLAQHGGTQPGCQSPGCAPPIDSKFEGTFGCRLSADKKANCVPNPAAGFDGKGNAKLIGDQDNFDVSNVDGWTLPFKLTVDGSNCAKAPPKNTVDCMSLGLDSCTIEDLSAARSDLTQVNLSLINPDTNERGGCYSPCSILSMNNWNNPDFVGGPGTPSVSPFCCPAGTPKETCAAAVGKTNYVKNVPNMCSPAYTWAYDDAQGLFQCDAKSTSYTMTFECPLVEE